jgi:uncharacterized protein (TIGR03083 family)
VTNSPSWSDPLEELHFALAEGDADTVTDGLRRRVVVAGLAARGSGRHVDVEPAISSLEAFRRAAASLDQLLSALDDDEWHATTGVRDLRVQGLVGHLIGVELDFRAGIDGLGAAADHVAGTEPQVRAQMELPPLETLARWRRAVAASLERLDELDREPAAMDEPARMHSVRLPLGQLLVARTFELWAHEEDMRRGTGRPLSPPDTPSLQLMTQLAIDMVPFAAPARREDQARRRARIVLTGPGGGSWTSELDAAPDGAAGTATEGSVTEGPVDVRLVVDAVDFCRLFANRMDPRALEVDVAGDRKLASELLVGLTSLALD